MSSLFSIIILIISEQRKSVSFFFAIQKKKKNLARKRIKKIKFLIYFPQSELRWCSEVSHKRRSRNKKKLVDVVSFRHNRDHNLNKLSLDVFS